MSGYRNRPWKERYAIMGDSAESVFHEVAPFGRAMRFGWRRPEVSMQRMAPRIRHMPDFYCATGHVVEVMGCGKDKILKLKVSKLDALEWWAEAGNPVALFAWNSHLRSWVLVPLESLSPLARRCPLDRFREDKGTGDEYHAIPWDDLVEADEAMAGEA